MRRLQFLLGQSDLFAHFGVGNKSSADSVTSPPPKKKTQSGADHRNRGGETAELDEEELEMLEEEAEETGQPKAKKFMDSLKKQPSVIAGEMRCVRWCPMFI